MAKPQLLLHQSYYYCDWRGQLLTKLYGPSSIVQSCHWHTTSFSHAFVAMWNVNQNNEYPFLTRAFQEQMELCYSFCFHCLEGEDSKPWSIGNSEDVRDRSLRHSVSKTHSLIGTLGYFISEKSNIVGSHYYTAVCLFQQLALP